MTSLFSQSPIYIRIRQLTELVDKLPIKELEYLFPNLIVEIFGRNSTTGWGLRTMKLDSNYYTFQAVLTFLSPQGPLFRLCYRLLQDCHLQYEFPLDCLPAEVKSKIADNDSPYGKQKVFGRSKIHPGNSIYLNALEYYMFHFTYHLLNPSMQIQSQHLNDWDTIYLRLVDQYLDYFLPCTSSVVYPILDESLIGHRTPFRPLNPPSSSLINTHKKKSPSIIREDALQKLSPGSPSFGRAKPVSDNAHVWRTELVAALFVDFWLSYGNEDSDRRSLYLSSVSYRCQPVMTFYQNYMTYQSGNTSSLSNHSTMNAVDSLPTKELLRCVRLLLRHLHYFSNHILQEECAMNDLKRELLPKNRRTIYRFFRQSMHQLPLDSTYKYLLEAWFTYIQPWKYTNTYMKDYRPKEIENCLPPNWSGFIAENLLFYTNLYFVIINRISRCDLNTFRVSHIIHRLTEVFSQSSLTDKIRELDSHFEEKKGKHLDGLFSVIYQGMCHLEDPEFRYEPFYSQAHQEQVLNLIERIRYNMKTLEWNRKKLGYNIDNENCTWSEWLKKTVLYDDSTSILDEIRTCFSNFSTSLKTLIVIHKITDADHLMNISSPDDYEDRTLLLNQTYSDFDSDVVDGSRIFSSSFSVDPKEHTRKIHSTLYEGDPDLQPIRSWECKFLVRVFYYICLWFNISFSSSLHRLYNENSIFGGVVRQLLLPSQTVYYYDNCNSPTGYSQKIEAHLPPRLSLRPYATYNFILFLVFLFCIITFFKLSVLKMTFVFGSTYLLFLFLSAIFHPLPIPQTSY